MVLVRTVVGDVQLAVTIYEGQVAVAVQTARMPCTDGNKVAVIDIVDSGGGITEYGGGIGVHVATTTGNITSGKDGVVDVDASFLLNGAHIYVVSFGRPGVTRLGFQRIQVGGGDIRPLLIGMGVV